MIKKKIGFESADPVEFGHLSVIRKLVRFPTLSVQVLFKVKVS
jgi:hypothetical protein